MWTFLLQPTSPGAVIELIIIIMMYTYSPHSWGFVNIYIYIYIYSIYIYIYIYKFYKVHCVYVSKLNLLFMQVILYCMTYSYITIISMHTQALYWSCIELIKDLYLNHNRKVPNALWMIMCTHSIDHNCFNLSKVFIEIYNTKISIATVYLYCF